MYFCEIFSYFVEYENPLKPVGLLQRGKSHKYSLQIKKIGWAAQNNFWPL